MILREIQAFCTIHNVVFVVGVDKFRSKPTCQAKWVFGISSSCLLSLLKNGILFKGMLFEGLLVKYTYSSITITLGDKAEGCCIYVFLLCFVDVEL